MAEYTPTTQRVRDCASSSDKWLAYSPTSFDRWLAAVVAAAKAEAWDEGFNTGYDQVLVERASSSSIDLRKNPYRTAVGGENR